VSDFRRELEYAWRRLRRAPAFTITAAIVLTIGIGATATAFSILNGVLLRPLPYAHPEQLMDLSHSTAVAGAGHLQQSDGTFLLYQRHATAFDGIAAYREYGMNLGVLGASSGEAKRVSMTGVSASLLNVLGVAPARGRGFVVADDQKDSPHVVILSDGLWRRSFGAAENILGQRVVLDGNEAEVIGVMPSSFHFPNADAEAWEPLRFDPAHTQTGSFNYSAIGRLKPNMTRQQAVAEMNRLLPNVLGEFPDKIPKEMWTQAKFQGVVTPLRDTIVGDVSRMLWILFGAVGLVLLIACANVANLFLVRAEGRQRELAVRTALGAGRGSLVSQYLNESFLLAFVGGLLGLVLAYFGVRVLSTLPGMNLPRLSEAGVDARVVAFSAIITVLSAGAVSLLPLLRTRRIAISSVLKESGRSATSGADRQRARGIFVIVQVAMALVLIAASGLMARSFARLRNVSPGFDEKNVIAMRLALPTVRYASTASRTRFYDELLTRVKALPGVQSVSLTTWLPLSSDNNTSVTEIEDHPAPPGSVPRVHAHLAVTSGYLGTMHTPMLSGRTFEPSTGTRPITEAMVSRSFAERYWKGSSALGKRVRNSLDGPWYTIVGVVGDVHLHTLDQPAEEAIYFPMVTPAADTAYAERYMTLLVRSEASGATLSPSIRRIVHDLDPALPTYGEHSMSDVVDSATARTRFTMLLLGLASAIALILGAVGIYGVMAYGVSVRQREIGVRMALGARPGDVSWMISRQGMVLAGVGIVIGLGASVALTRFLRGLLYDVSPMDPVALIGAAISLLGVTILASWIPAHRAAAVDPAYALRSD
jgi:putative ABC transport system permease protein